MIPSRYNAPILEQTAAAEEALALLLQFANKHPHLQPFCLYTGIPGVSFDSNSIGVVRDTFGPDGWRVEGTLLRKEVDGVLLEVHLPKVEPQPFTL